MLASATQTPTNMTAKGQCVIRDHQPGHIYITQVPGLSPLFTTNPSVRSARDWRTENQVWVFMGEKVTSCLIDQEDWIIIRGKVSQGCYIEGGEFNGFIIEEIGTYLDE